MRREEPIDNIPRLKMIKNNDDPELTSGKTGAEVQNIREVFDDIEGLLLFGTWQWDAFSGKVTWSDGMYRILGYDRESTQLRVTDDFYLHHLDFDEAAQFREFRARAIADKTPFEYTYRITTNDNRSRVITTKMKFVYDQNGQVLKGVGFNRDVTEKTQMLRDLMHYKKMVEQKEEFLNIGTWDFDLHTDKLNMSDGMMRLIGLGAGQPGELPDLLGFYRLYLTANDNRKLVDVVYNADREETYVRQSAITTGTGETKMLETFGKIQRDALGNPIKIAGITHDVTKLKQYEQELEVKVDELNRSNHELEEFAYVASHDLQEPLRKISTFGERLQTRCGDQLSEEGIAYLNRILASAENMRGLINNLLDFSRVTRMQHAFVKSNIRQIILQVLEELDLSIEDSHAMIDLQAMPEIEVIPEQIKQLFRNLLSNALKFQRAGIPLQISISHQLMSREEKEKQKLRHSRRYHKFIVTDNGIGFEEEYAERIFQLFQRLHGKSEYPGSGIGLAICRKIADNHHGMISASSQPDHGAAFTIILPDTQ
ncbi:PAS domain-containing protein [Pseudoflavitalea sp. G-6-1-2]|uniref:sensor histidine kinase n=1 Tax=Pseudoflavitalea sp. G-6-1-2 TaxID=2728841 RepID=UPI00146EBA6E|nr:ATP-binding protein [Pseudoflavitalea sp. G-6-1-2]NML22476.1 PAS domain-containing protein [Pseudoflavitalea sp. G-6-1-2]